MTLSIPVQPPFDASVVRVVAALLGPGAVVPEDPFSGLDPEACCYVSRYWHVAPRLWLKLRQSAGVPSLIGDQLRTEYWRTVNSSARLRTAANELIATFNGLGIEPMLLKGGCHLFDPPAGHAGTRVMVDLDVLVPQGQDRLCFDTLCGLGFVPEEDWDSDRFHHWPKLTRTGGGEDEPLVVEIHKTPWLGGGIAETEAFFALSVPATRALGSARLPCTTHRLLLNAVHAFEGQFRHYAVSQPSEFDDAIGCTNLRQILDFVDLCSYRRDSFEWEGLLAEADRFNRRDDLKQWAFLARELCAAPVPDRVARWHVGRPEPRTIEARCERVAKRILRNTGLLSSVRRLRRAWFS
jgi:hypothetical protein